MRIRETTLGWFLHWCEERSIQAPRDLTRAVIERYQQHLYRYRKSDGEPLTYGSQVNRLNPVRAFCKWLLRENLVLADPAAVLRDLQNEGSCPAPREFRGLQRKPGSLGLFKGRDAHEAENKIPRDAGKAAGLDDDQIEQLHDEITGRNLTYAEILQIAISIKNGTH